MSANPSPENTADARLGEAPGQVPQSAAPADDVPARALEQLGMGVVQVFQQLTFLCQNNNSAAARGTVPRDQPPTLDTDTAADTDTADTATDTADTATDTTAQPALQRLERIEQTLSQIKQWIADCQPSGAVLPDNASHPPGTATTGSGDAPSADHAGAAPATEEAVFAAELVAPFAAASPAAADPLAPPAKHVPPELSPSTQPIQQMLFGDAGTVFAGDDATRQALAGDCLRRVPAACSLAAVLLAFEFSPKRERHQWLKPLGEAWYGWHPKHEDDPVEHQLVQWVNQACFEADLPLSVETVRTGVRFDSERHLAVGQTGRDVAEVRGWVVVRNRQAVFSKALVVSR